MDKREKTLLWIDDNIHMFSEYVDSLKETGLIVVTASNLEEAELAFTQYPPKVVLCDIKMPSPDGIDIINKLHAISKEHTFGVFSSFLYLHEYKQRLKDMPFVHLLDKDFPNTHSECFRERFIAPILKLFEYGVTYNAITAQTPRKNVINVDPFIISFAEFMSLPIQDKDHLADLAEKKASTTIKNAFNRGKIWILLCGDKDEVVASADNFNEILEEKDILEYAQRRNLAFYQFSSTFINEDYWTPCSSNISLENYPTITFVSNGKTLDLHFDTGNPISVLSYEDFVNEGIINPVTQFSKETRNGFPPYRCAIVKDLKLLIQCQHWGETIAVKINAKAVRDWGKHQLCP